MFRLIIIIFCFIIKIETTKTTDINSGAWLSHCGSNQVKVSAINCGDGVNNFNTTNEQPCLCLNGLWQIYEKDSTETHFFLGNNKCFHFKKQINYIKPIGNPYHPFQSTTLYFQNGILFENNEKIINVNNFIKNQFIILQINPVQNLEIRNGNQKCLIINAKSSHLTNNHIVKIIQKIDTKNNTNLCLNFDIQILSTSTIASKNLVKRGAGPVFKRDYSYEEISSPILISQSEEQFEYSTHSPIQIPLIDAYSCAGCIIKSEISYKSKLLQINQETERAIKAHHATILQNFETEAPSQSWSILKNSLKVLQKSCPISEMISFEILNTFKFFVLYTDEVYPGSLKFESFDGNLRIIKNLKNCFKSNEKYEFINYSWKEYCYNVLDNKYRNSTGHYLGIDGACKCMRQPTTVNYNGKNVSIQEIPNNERVNFKKDFVLEIVWKIFMFSYYECTGFFAQYPLDLSTFYIVFENYFNNGLFFRWNNPGNSFNAYKKLFSGNDLEEFSNTIDNCLSVAYNKNEHKTWLLRRPSKQGKRRRRRRRDIKMHDDDDGQGQLNTCQFDAYKI